MRETGRAHVIDRVGALPTNDYSVPTAYGFRDVVVKGFVDQVVISCAGE